MKELDPMHVLFVHPAYPAQFGHIARRLAEDRGYACTFVSEESSGNEGPVQRIPYRPTGGESSRRRYLTQDFDEEVSHAEGVFEALKPLRDSLRPDLIVGHAGWGGALFLPELFPGTPVIDYVEYYSHPHGSAIDFRPEWPASEATVLRHRLQNAGVLLNLEQCTAAYTPTRFQHRLLPDRYRSKVRVIYDGIDTEFWRRSMDLAGPEGGTRFVTYVSRGLEAMRGFDVFMQVARLIGNALPDVVFLVVGSDDVIYGHELDLVEEATFKEHVLAGGGFDLERIRFLGWLPPERLMQVFNMSDLHIYLTVPFVVSWSLLNAMACGCTILASDTEPVREIVRDGADGLLRGFSDVEALAETAISVLEDPLAYRDLGRTAERKIRRRYSLEVTVPKLASFFEEVVAGRT
jgi:glycosyltransferase involved in cell wall biosynthesis